jgi:hypothetical protein
MNIADSLIDAAESVVSQEVLEAARAALKIHERSLPVRPGVSPRNLDLLRLCECLIDGALVTAAAMADNAWEDHHALPHADVNALIARTSQVTALLADATQVPR